MSGGLEEGELEEEEDRYRDLESIRTTRALSPTRIHQEVLQGQGFTAEILSPHSRYKQAIATVGVGESSGSGGGTG